MLGPTLVMRLKMCLTQMVLEWQDKQDGKIMPKPGLRKNKLVAKYGTNFRYLGIVKNGIDRVTVVTSIPIPRYENVKIKPINFAKCAQSLDNDRRQRA